MTIIPRRTLPATAVLLAFALSAGCFNRGTSPDASAERDPRLGALAEIVAPATTANDDTSAAVGSAATRATAAGGTPPPAIGSASTTTALAGETRNQPDASTSATDPFRQAASVSDAAGDHGVGGAAYADAVEVSVDENGSRLRVTVRVAGTIPMKLTDGEVAGVGIDFVFEGLEYQLFADGGVDGWRAFLHTPQGFVQFPGTFHLLPTALEFEVPWPAFGGRRTGRFEMFIDWSKRRVPLNASSTDRAPDRAGATLSV